jgi:hypothetical protein
MKTQRKHLAFGRRIGMIIISLSILFTSGCFHLFSNREPVNKYRYSTEYTVEQDVMEAVVQAIEEKDTETLKSLFSEKSCSEIQDMDQKLEDFSQYVDGEIESFEKNGGGSDRLSDYGYVVHDLSANFDLYTSSGKYIVGFRFFIRNDGDRSVEGLTSILIITEELYDESLELEGPTCDLSVPDIYYFYDLEEQKQAAESASDETTENK